MPDNDPKNESPSPKNTNGAPNTPGTPGGVNWRAIISISAVAAVLVILWKVGGTPSKPEQLDFSEFVTLYHQGRVVEDESSIPEIKKLATNEEKLKKLKELGIKTDPTLLFVGPEGGSSGILRGYFDSTERIDRSLSPDKSRFRVSVNLDLAGKEINDLFYGENVATLTVNEIPAAVNARHISLSELRQLVAQKLVDFEGNDRVTIYTESTTNRSIIEGVELIYNEKKNVETHYRPLEVPVNIKVRSEQDMQLINKIAEHKYESGTLQAVLINLLPFLFIILLLFFLIRHQMKASGKGAMNFGKSKAKLMSQDKNKVTFKDVAGIDEAKEELVEIVEFLKDPKRFQKLGGNIPKGVLMVGPPGTGKTLLARSIAGEADVPFFSISGSDFVEMFVGVGASRVRDMFEQGKKNAPCLIFIDEIDAVGRHRGQGMGGGHDEREQTLNQMLVEMDGFDARQGVIIIAATNRPDVLDPALLRPGRFDRQVSVSLPDLKGREQILKVHAQKIKMAEGVELTIIARGTPGFSGAELANLINESALLAARKGLTEVSQPELEEARDKVRWGRERRSMALSEQEKEVTAYHEAGHAILLALLENTDSLHKVTIIPRGPYLGAAFHLPKEDRYQYRKNEGLEQLIVTMGGRVAEELTFGDVTSGASGDIKQATSLARKMVCEWGMSDLMGMVEYIEPQGASMMGGMGAKTYSEDTAQKIDAEIKRLIDEAYEEAKRILSEHHEALKNIAQALLEYETLDGAHIDEIIATGSMQDPPKMPEPPEPPSVEVPKDGSASSAGKSEKDDDDPLAGEVVGAPA